MNVLNQWLEELYQELQGISEDDRKDILESYEEQINEMIDLKINEREILSKLGSPKKVAQEIKQSFTDTETVSAQNKQIVFNIREKTNDDVIKKAIFIVVCIISLFVSLFFLITALRLIIGGFLLFQLSAGLMIAILGLGLLFLNIGIASIYIGYLGYKRISEKIRLRKLVTYMRKKGLERYLIISSIASIVIIVVSFVSATFYNPTIKQSLQYGAVSELIEQYSLGLIDLEDLFD